MRSLGLSGAVRASAVIVVIALGAGLAVACSGKNRGAPDLLWTEQQASSIRSIRGTPVRVRYCHGIGPGQKVGGTIVYRSFDCLAGTKIEYQWYESVGVTYTLRTAGAYRGSASRYTLTNVHFDALQAP